MPPTHPDNELRRHDSGDDSKLTALALDTLDSLSKLASKASSMLAGHNGPSPDALAQYNTLNSEQAYLNLAQITGATRESIERLAREPAIARIVVRDENDREEVIYISRSPAGTGLLPGKKVASYYSPLGRLAAAAVGSEIDLRTGRDESSFEIIERATLTPSRSGSEWDSQNTILESLASRRSTIRSLRALIGKQSTAPQTLPSTSPRAPKNVEPSGEELFAALIGADPASEQNTFEGLRRSVITKMGLRDRPILDGFQDEIFRLPLYTRLAIMGPPGTGKTTTLIKRLAQKIDWEYLTTDEQRIVDRSHAGRDNHGSSWLVITPTELLRLYVKEAFANEKVAAPDSNIKTWDDIRLDLARNVFGILSSATRSGAIMDEELNNLLPEAIQSQRQWYDEFDRWQRAAFFNDLKDPAKLLAASRDPEAEQVGQRLRKIIEISNFDNILQALVRFSGVADRASEVATRLRTAITNELRREFSLQLEKDRTLFDKLLAFLLTLTEKEPDETDDDGDADEATQLLRPQTREDAFNAYVAAMRTLAAARIDNRSVPPRSKNGRIIEWLGDRIPSSERLLEIGKLHKQVSALRRFSSPLKSYGDGFLSRYRRFRREQLAQNNWYRRPPDGNLNLHPLEVDLLLYSTMAYGRAVVADPSLGQYAQERSLPLLRALDEISVNQVLIDEIADFSPLQIACMAQLGDPATSSILACGDFNQRITLWGSRSTDDLAWALPGLVVRNIRITYRHSRQIQDFIEKLLIISGVSQDKIQLPDLIDNEGFRPALALSADGSKLVEWLAARIREIEHLVSPAKIPSIAILVNSESQVLPLATALDRALRPFSIRCVGCERGLVRGHDSDVRVFDVQHIKGLEFEAVFFVDVDELAKLSEELFDKYLYVGTTRAALYLGLTCSGSSLPPKISHLHEQFVGSWIQ